MLAWCAARRAGSEGKHRPCPAPKDANKGRNEMEKIEAAAQRHPHPCSLLEADPLRCHVALHGEGYKQTEGPPLGKSEAVELDDASRNTNRAWTGGSRESAHRFPHHRREF
nr:unnamed protein product [Digitaria exilis]